MSFAAETQNIVDQLIQAEYKYACENWGDKYNSLHEAYAVLKEEIEEVQNDFNFINNYFNSLWGSIKQDYAIDHTLICLEDYTKHAMKELAQCGAVLQKIQNTIFGEVEE